MKFIVSVLLQILVGLHYLHDYIKMKTQGLPSISFVEGI